MKSGETDISQVARSYNFHPFLSWEYWISNKYTLLTIYPILLIDCEQNIGIQKQNSTSKSRAMPSRISKVIYFLTYKQGMNDQINCTQNTFSSKGNGKVSLNY